MKAIALLLTLALAWREYVCGDISKQTGSLRSVSNEPLDERRLEFEGRIVGGTRAQNGRYLYAQVSLQTSWGLHQCGGSVIAPDVILTAGHCSGYFNQIVVNAYNLANSRENRQVFSAARMIFPPNFEAKMFRHDLLIIQLNGTIEGVEPIQLNYDPNTPNVDEDLTVLGWGLTNPNDASSYPDIIRQVSVSYLSNSACEGTTYDGRSLYDGYIFSEMMCAAERGRDACSGDSGAPLILPGITPEEDVQVGIVSWGNGCATAYPGVYTRVSYQYDWVQGVICSISNNPPDYFGCPNNNPVVEEPPSTGSDSDVDAGETAVVSSPGEGTIPVRVEIQLDLKCEETGWYIQSSTGQIIRRVPIGEYRTPYAFVEETIHLEPEAQYVFVIEDDRGNGICCQYGGGWYQVQVVQTDGTSIPLVKGYGTFSLVSSNTFETPQNNTAPVVNTLIGIPPLPAGVEPIENLFDDQSVTTSDDTSLGYSLYIFYSWAAPLFLAISLL